MRHIKGIFAGEPMIYEARNLEEQMSLGKNFGFVSAKPEKLWSNIEWVGPISRKARDCGKSQRLFQVLRFGVSAAIHPDERIAQRAAPGIDRQECGCLGADCNGSHAFFCGWNGAHDLANDRYDGMPPVLGILLDPTGSDMVRKILFARYRKGAAANIDQHCFYGCCADIDA
jgi:hypothetical protein